MNYFGEDVRVSFSQPYRIDRVTQLAMSTPGVAHTELWVNTAFHRIRPDGSMSDSVEIRAPEWGSNLMKPQILRGRWLLKDDQNALVVDAKFLSKEADLDVGSRVTMRLGDTDNEWVIVGVVPQFGNGSPISYTNYAIMSRLEQNLGWTSSLRVVGAQHGTTSQKALADTLTQRFKDNAIRVDAVRTSAEYRQSNQQVFDIITTFLVIMAFQIAIVGGIGLMGTMSMNVVERTREIGVLRAIGASDQDIQLIIVTEGLLIGLISWVLAAIAALPISRVLTDELGKAFLNNPLPAAYALNSLGAWLGIVFALAAVASILPAWRASSLTVSEVLTYE
jgi:putative ABC transport system permease protein